MNITSRQPFKLTLAGKDQYGDPLPVAGTATWNVSDTGVVNVEPGVDGISATMTPEGSGTASVGVSLTTSDGSVLGTSLSVSVSLPAAAPAPAPAPTAAAGAPKLTSIEIVATAD